MKKRAIERVSDRCQRICGEKREDCYVNSKSQINCIADMVINKTTSMGMLLRGALESDDLEFVRDTIRESMNNSTELSNWVRYLQIVPDLQNLSTLVLDADSEERRTEIRYPLPEDKRPFINVLLGDGKSEGELVNFSQSGLQVLSTEPFDKGMVLDCQLTARISAAHAISFRAAVMYAVPAGDAHIMGMRVMDVQGGNVFNIFGTVHQLMVDVDMDSIL